MYLCLCLRVGMAACVHKVLRTVLRASPSETDSGTEESVSSGAKSHGLLLINRYDHEVFTR